MQKSKTRDLQQEHNILSPKIGKEARNTKSLRQFVVRAFPIFCPSLTPMSQKVRGYIPSAPVAVLPLFTTRAITDMKLT